MAALPFDSRLYGDLLSDAEIASRLDDAAQLRAMLAFEAALARAEAVAICDREGDRSAGPCSTPSLYGSICYTAEHKLRRW